MAFSMSRNMSRPCAAVTSAIGYIEGVGRARVREGYGQRTHERAADNFPGNDAEKTRGLPGRSDASGLRGILPRARSTGVGDGLALSGPAAASPGPRYPWRDRLRTTQRVSQVQPQALSLLQLATEAIH